MNRTGMRLEPSMPVLAAALLSAVSSCGVRDYPHELAVHDPNSDFGPIHGDAMQPPPPPPPPMYDATPPPFDSSGPADDGAFPPPTADASYDGAPPPPPPPPPRDAAAEAPLSGVTITLGGVAVPKENVIAFI